MADQDFRILPVEMIRPHGRLRRRWWIGWPARGLWGMFCRAAWKVMTRPLAT